MLITHYLSRSKEICGYMVCTGLIDTCFTKHYMSILHVKTEVYELMSFITWHISYRNTTCQISFNNI